MTKEIQHPELEKDIEVCKALTGKENKPVNPRQSQDHQPGSEKLMHPKPISIYDSYIGTEKFKDKVVLITGGDSGIGRAVAYHFACEKANIYFTYLDETDDAHETEATIKEMGVKVQSFSGDLSNFKTCQEAINNCLAYFGQIDILINNIAVQFPTTDFLAITPEQLQKTFSTNLFSFFYMAQLALPHMKADSSIINSTSVTAYHGHQALIDYSASKGAITAFTRSLAKQLQENNIRVNAVAPGPVWTPLIPATFSAEQVEEFGRKTMYGKPAQPADIAPCYIFLASEQSKFLTGQVLHPNGGEYFNP